MTPEAKVKAKVKKVLKEFGAWNFVPVSNGMGVHGIPDIIACYYGQFFGIECKAPNKKSNVSALQRVQLNGIKKAGGVAIVVATDEDIQALKKLLTEMRLVATD